MKVASTLFLTTLCCASAFGLHGTASKAMKKVGLGGNRVPMVQPIDITGERSSAITALGQCIQSPCMRWIARRITRIPGQVSDGYKSLIRIVPCLVSTQTLKSSTADEAPRGGAEAKAGFDFGLMIYFALWYLG
eukprot:scaffold1307_cov151-Amphora_coffeaeformis.AAC.11